MIEIIEKFTDATVCFVETVGGFAAKIIDKLFGSLCEDVE